MRKYMLFGASMLLLALAACTREKEVVTDSVKLSFKAVVDDGATRTAYENDKTASWVAGDQISVYVTNGSSGQVVTFTADESLTFNGEAPAGYTTIVAGAYPADAAHVFGPEGLQSLHFPASYTLAEGADPASILPLAGTFADGQMTFRHPAGALKFSIDNVPSTAVRFNFTTFGDKINGTFALDPTLEDTVVDAEKSVDINFPAAEGSRSFYVPVPAGELYPESVISLYDADNKILFQKVVPTALTVSKNVIKRIAAVSSWNRNEKWQATYLRDVYNSSSQKFGSYVQISGTTGLYDNVLYATGTFNNLYGSVEGFLASSYIPNQKANGRQPRDKNLIINYNRLSPGPKTVVIYGVDENYNFTGEYNIVEFEVPEFTTPEGWSMTFYPQYNSTNYGVVPAVTFKNPGGRTWTYSYMSKEVYASYGSDPAVFIWSKRTATNTLLTSASATYVFTSLTPGEYVFISFGMNERADSDSDRTPTYEYCVMEVNYESPSDAYQSWIGKWNVTDDTPKTDTWNVSAKSNNYTYNVTGLGGNGGITVEALFDAETGNLKFKSQKDFQTIVKDGEERQICLYGTNGSTYWTSIYDLMSAAFNEGTTDAATLTACDEKYTKYKLYGFVDGSNKYNYGTRTLPSTMERVVSSGVMLPDGWSVTALEGAGMENAAVFDGTEVVEAE